MALGLFGLFTSTIFLGLVGIGRGAAAARGEAEEKSLRGAGGGGRECFCRGDADEASSAWRGAGAGGEPAGSFMQQDYFERGVAEFLFCARTEDDAGLAVARRVAAEYPQIPDADRDQRRAVGAEREGLLRWWR